MSDAFTTRLPRFLAWASGLYGFCWVIAYMVVNQDFNVPMMLNYFWLAWTFTGGERPASIQFLSVILLLLLGGVGLAVRASEKRGHKR